MARVELFNPANLTPEQKAILARIVMDVVERQDGTIVGAIIEAQANPILAPHISDEVMDHFRQYVTTSLLSLATNMGLSPFDLPEVQARYGDGESPSVPPCGECGHDSAQTVEGCDCACHTLFAGVLGYVEEV